MRPRISTPYDLGYATFQKGVGNSPHPTMSEDRAAEFRRGYNDAKAAATPDEMKAFHGIKAVRDHVSRSGQAYLFVTPSKELATVSFQAARFNNLLKSGAELVGCYTKPLNPHHIKEDLLCSLN